MVEFGNINAYINHEVVAPFLKSDTVISTSDYHRRLDGNKYSDLLRQHPAINNSDKGSGNTLLGVVKATGKNQKSTVSECIKPRY